MKTVVIKNYLNSLASFLDDENINWKSLPDQSLSFEIKGDEDLFNLGMRFEEYRNNIN